MRRTSTIAIFVGMLALAPVALGFDEQREDDNFAKTEERERYIVSTPEFQKRLDEQEEQDNLDLAEIAAAEAAAGPDARNFAANVCSQRKRECAGDVRTYDWEANGFGVAEPVLFGARSGATLSGKVWATERGPAKRPGIVITTGSVQAPETLYWGAAQVLAKHGYVVLTYDVQGQGRSDTFGEVPDTNEGVPSQAGQPFFDGTEDALDFLLSSPGSPYDPRPSCGNATGGVGTDHSAKHERRVGAGLNAEFNPFWKLVDRKRIGIAGHSLGAAAVSYIGQLDDRVDAIVAWDNLRDSGGGGGNVNFSSDCPSGSSPRPETVPLTKPAIGMSNDYGLTPQKKDSDPDPDSANAAFEEYKAKGVDSMQMNRRGGTHYEYSFLPGETVPQLGLATLRGNDMEIWYTTAWFDRYVKCQGDVACAADADRRLLTDRWRKDARERQVDAAGDRNLFSFYLTSRFDLTDAAGRQQVCDDVRAGCANMGPDGGPPGYDFLADANRLDRPGGGGGGGGGGGAPGGGSGPGPGARCSIGREGTAANDTPRTLPPTDGGDAIRGRRGNDRLRGGPGDDCLFGNRGDDTLAGDGNEDRLAGGRGRDQLRGNDGADGLRGGRHDDELRGARGVDLLQGARGADLLVGGRGRDHMRGGRGPDRFRAADGRNDSIRCGRGRDLVIADRRDQVAASCERVRIG